MCVCLSVYVSVCVCVCVSEAVCIHTHVFMESALCVMDWNGRAKIRQSSGKFPNQ